MGHMVNGRMDESYVAGIDFAHNREVSRKLLDRYSEGMFLDFFQKTGREKHVVSDQTEFHHFEEDYMFATAVIGAVSGTGAGNPVTITFNAASHQNSGTKSPFMKGDNVLIGTMRGWIQTKTETTPNAHQIVVKPVNSADDLSTAATVSATVTQYSNANAEGTGQPDSEVSTPLKYSGKVQIFKKHYAVTGTEATNKIEFDVDGKPYYMYKGVGQCEKKFKALMEYGFLLGIENVGLTDTAEAGKEVRTTKGMDQWIVDEGNQVPYTGSFNSIATLNTIVKTLNKNSGAAENLWLNGVDLDLDLDDLITTEMQSGGILYNQWGKGNGKEKAVDMGCNSFTKGGYTFHKKRFDALNHPKVTAATTDSPWPATGYIVPLTQFNDAKSGELSDSIRIRYKKQDGGGENRLFEHWVRTKEVTNKDEIEFNYLSECGLQMALLNKYVKIYKS